jgi:hypothetical protein
MINANEEISSKPGGIGQILAQNGLFDILANQHITEKYPPTYARGSKRIDYIFATESVQTHCKSSGILPMHHGYPSDHRAVFIRIDLQKILSTEIHPLESISMRLINAATPKEQVKFLQELHEHYESQNLYSRLEKLWSIPAQEWTDADETEYNKCDRQHIDGMLAPERKTCKIKQFTWSPKYSKAVEEKSFWKIALSIRKNHQKPNPKIIEWANSMGIQDIISIPINVINSKLRDAQKQLRDIKSKSAEIREEHLRELLAISQTSKDDKQQENRPCILIRVHQKQYAYKRLQYILKPSQRGGLSHILVPEYLKPTDYPYNPESVKNWSLIHDHDLVQQFIQQRNITHFSQAHGTPFTIPPLTKRPSSCITYVE